MVGHAYKQSLYVDAASRGRFGGASAKYGALFDERMQEGQ